MVPHRRKIAKPPTTKRSTKSKDTHLANKRVFLSFSSLDNELGDLFFEVILKSGLGLENKVIFYTGQLASGARGDDFVEGIKKSIKQCKIFIPLLTVNYFDSQMCCFELGGAWISNISVNALLVRPYAYEDLARIYIIRNNDTSYINTEDGLEKLRMKMEEKGLCKLTSSDELNWNDMKKNFIEKSKSIIENIEHSKKCRTLREWRIDIPISTCSRKENDIKTLIDYLKENDLIDGHLRYENLESMTAVHEIYFRKTTDMQKINDYIGGNNLAINIRSALRGDNDA